MTSKMRFEEVWFAFIEEVRRADETTCRAMAGTMLRVITARRAGEKVDDATMDRWFDEELARVLWPYQH